MARPAAAGGDGGAGLRGAFELAVHGAEQALGEGAELVEHAGVDGGVGHDSADTAAQAGRCTLVVVAVPCLQ
jgi:hypothetical protein